MRSIHVSYTLLNVLLLVQYLEENILAAVQRSDVDRLDEHVKDQILWRECKHKKSGDTALHIAATTGCITIMRCSNY